MKKYYGVHRLYGGVPPELTLQVIVVDNGQCVAYHPLSEETPFTEWLGGAAILSGEEAVNIRFPATMDAIRDLLLGTAGNNVWHIGAEDCSSGMVSRIRRLR